MGPTNQVAENTQRAVEEHPGKVYCLTGAYGYGSSAQMHLLTCRKRKSTWQRSLQLGSPLAHKEAADSTPGGSDERRDTNGVSSRGQIKERARGGATNGPCEHKLPFAKAEQAPRFFAKQSRIDNMVDGLCSLHAMMLEEENQFAVRFGFALAYRTHVLGLEFLGDRSLARRQL